MLYCYFVLIVFNHFLYISSIGYEFINTYKLHNTV